MEAKAAGDPVILVRIETSPTTCTACSPPVACSRPRRGDQPRRVVARSLGLPCVAGAETLRIDYGKREMKAGKVTIREGDMISIDGTTGEVFAGELPTIEARFEDEHDLATLLSWADEIRRMQVWANADYPRDAERARPSGRRASACAGPSTCSSRRSGCRPCSA